MSEAEAHRQLDLEIARFEQQERSANQRNTALAIAGIALVGAAAAAASDSGGGYSGYSAATDYSWDWDRYVGPYGNYQWRCRGVQTGQFAPSYRCAGMMRDDDRWPG